MKTFKQLVLAFLILFSGTSYAQISLFEDFLRGGEEDGNILLNHYMTPALKGLGFGVNNGWYNTAKPHETFGFDITFSYINAIVPEEDKTFEFIQSEYIQTFHNTGPTTLPTLMGGLSTTNLEYGPDAQTIIDDYDTPDGIAEDINSYSLIKDAVPMPIIQAGIGIIKGTEIKIRWLPNFNIGDGGFTFKYFGLGGLHSISQWLPVFKDIPVDISAFVGGTNISAAYDIPSGNISGEGQRASGEVNTFTYQLLASAHVSVLTGYVGLGYDNYNTTFKMLGEYQIVPGVPASYLNDPISLEQSGNGGFRTSFGARLKVSIITLSADYTLREYDTLTLALGFSVR